jgi:hypothetical protein
MLNTWHRLVKKLISTHTANYILENQLKAVGVYNRLKYARISLLCERNPTQNEWSFILYGRGFIQNLIAKYEMRHNNSVNIIQQIRHWIHILGMLKQ